MRVTRLIAVFALLGSLNLYAGSDEHMKDPANPAHAAPRFQNGPCGGWWMHTHSLFNGNSAVHHAAKNEEQATRFQNEPCTGWIMRTESLFNGHS